MFGKALISVGRHEWRSSEAQPHHGFITTIHRHRSFRKDANRFDRENPSAELADHRTQLHPPGRDVTWNLRQTTLCRWANMRKQTEPLNSFILPSESIQEEPILGGVYLLPFSCKC